MFCCDTRDLPAIDKKKLKHIHMTVTEAEEMSRVIPHVRVVRSFEHGNGEICIPFLNGVFDKIKTTFTDYLNAKKLP